MMRIQFGAAQVHFLDRSLASSYQRALRSEKVQAALSQLPDGVNILLGTSVRNNLDGTFYDNHMLGYYDNGQQQAEFNLQPSFALTKKGWLLKFAQKIVAQFPNQNALDALLGQSQAPSEMLSCFLNHTRQVQVGYGFASRFITDQPVTIIPVAGVPSIPLR